jgi:hypothetical protein
LANFDRGVYEPRNEPHEGTHEGIRVFDGSEEEDDIEGSRLPLLIVLALLVLAMFGGVVWLAYTQGVARGRGETPILTAAGGPERVAPQQAGGSNVPYQGFKIYEQPAPPDDSADAAPVAAAPSAPKPAQAAPAPPAPKPAQASAPAAAPPAPTTAAPKTTAAVPPVKAAPPPKSVAALIQQANSVPEPKAAAKTAKPAATPAPAVPALGPATGAPRQLAAATPAPTPAGSGYVLQIGAYKSQADAEGAWKTYKARHAGLLTGYSDSILQVDLGEKGTWYRLRINGLSDREVAIALCDRLKADGGACILGR